MTQKIRSVARMTLADVNDELQILEYIETNTRQGLTERDRLFLDKLLSRKQQLQKAGEA